MNPRTKLLTGIILVTAMAVIAVAVAVTDNYEGGSENHSSQGTPYTGTHELVSYKRALYYDPLYREYPNDTLISIVKTLLEDHGYNVTVALGMEAGLEELVVMNQYDLVVIRAHGTVNDEPAGVYPRGEYLYTGLYYNESLRKYGESIAEWVSEGYLAVGVIPPAGRDNLTQEELRELPKYLVVGPKFFSIHVNVKKGGTVIVFGCDTLSEGMLAGIMSSKGITLYVGWNGSVTNTFMDKTLPKVLEALLDKGFQGAKSYIDRGVIDPYSGATLGYIAKDGYGSH